jgi:hypothetical protein
LLWLEALWRRQQCDKQVTGDKAASLLALHILVVGFPLLECGPFGPLGSCASLETVLTSKL